MIVTVVSVSAVACHSRRWQVLTTDGNADAIPILALAFSDALHGWATTSTSILESQDGGKTWRSRMSAPGREFYQALVFRDRERGWAFGGRAGPSGSPEAAIWRTADGGRSWAEISTSIAGPITAATFCSSSLGFAVAPTRILRTSDGGLSWAVIYEASAEDRLLGIGCMGVAEACVVGSRRAALCTPDGGDSWKWHDLPANANLTRVYFTDRKGWILGLGGALLASEDDGKTWRSLAVPTNETLFDLQMNGAEGWIVGARGTILRSADGGRTWTRYESPTNNDLLALSFPASGGGWAGGSQMTVLRLAK